MPWDRKRLLGYVETIQLILGVTDKKKSKAKFSLTLYLIETPFSPFANRADPDQAALVRAAWSGSTLFAYGNMIYLILQ